MRRFRSTLAVVGLSVLALGAAQSGSSRIARAQVPTSSVPFVPLSGRLYVANEGTNSISVLAPSVDSSTNTFSSQIVGAVCLGSDTADDVPLTPGANFVGAPCDGNADHHKPFYDGQVGTHGLWLT